MIKQEISIKPLFYFLMGLSFFLLPLVHAWIGYPLGIENEYTHYSAVAGVMPYSDAAGYYLGATDFLENSYLDPWNLRRPLNAILFSMRLWAANNNFQIALLIQALLCGLSCLLVTNSISRTFGKFASAITLFVLFLFAAVFIPTTLSETLGLTIGCLGFVLLWEAIVTKRLWLFFSAGLMLIVGLNARAGAFFVMPLLVLWLGYHFRDQKKNHQFNWPIAVTFTFGLIAGFVYNWVLIKLYGNSDKITIAHGNFVYTLFGLVSGGKGWTYVYSVYPDIISSLEAPEVIKFLYLKSWEVFKNNPFLSILGVLRSWGATIKGLISFFQWQLPTNLVLKTLVRLFGFIVLCFSLYRLKELYKIYKDEIGLLGIVLFGMFLSAGIIWTDGGFRVFAVTVPFFAVALGVVISSYFFTPVLKNNHRLNVKTSLQWESYCALILSGFLLLTAMGGPKLIGLPRSLENFAFSCPTGEKRMVVRKITGAPHVSCSLQTEAMRRSIVRSLVENKPKQDFLSVLDPSTLTRAMGLGCVYNLDTRQLQYVFGPEELFSVQGACIGLCASSIPGNENIVQVQSYETLDAK